MGTVSYATIIDLPLWCENHFIITQEDDYGGVCFAESVSIGIFEQGYSVEHEELEENIDFSYNSHFRELTYTYTICYLDYWLCYLLP